MRGRSSENLVGDASSLGTEPFAMTDVPAGNIARRNALHHNGLPRIDNLFNAFVLVSEGQSDRLLGMSGPFNGQGDL